MYVHETGIAEPETTASRLAEIRERVSRLHEEIDSVTRELHALKTAPASNAVRRAEEAGASLARLEWELDRAADQFR